MKQTVTITGENMNVVVNNAETTPVATDSKKTKAQKRMETLKKLGYDMSKFFTLGDDDVVEIKGGKAIPVCFDELAVCGDVVEKKLVEGGYVNNWSLFRRWVMAQMFRMLRDMEKTGKSFNELLQRNGYEYQWQMLERELYAQAKMLKHGDTLNYKARQRWFNKNTAYSMASDYIASLRKYVEENLTYRSNRRGMKVYKHKCKGNPYIRLQNTNIFVADLQKKVYKPLEDMAESMLNAEDVQRLYNIVVKFNKTRKHLLWKTKHSSSFIDAYKGSGAYFTMRNLIMFHGAEFYGFSKAGSLLKVDMLAEAYINEGWKMMGAMKQLIKDSNISIQRKIDEWKD